MRDDLRRIRPTLTVRPEHSVDVPVWHWPAGIGHADAEELSELGVSARLIERLRNWNLAWEAQAFDGLDPREHTAGRPMRIKLARQLQRELPEHDIYVALEGGGVFHVDDLSD